MTGRDLAIAISAPVGLFPYHGGDPALRLFSLASNRWDLWLPQGARVLELGCRESNFAELLKGARPDILMVGVDVNDCPGYPGEFIKGPAEQLMFPESSFDAVIALGAIEHFGLGFYQDPLALNADWQTSARVASWLVPGGWFYYDVPWTPTEGYVSENRHYRVYDDRQIAERLTPNGMRAVARGYSPDAPVSWLDRRPSAPASPFWFLARLLEKEP